MDAYKNYYKRCKNNLCDNLIYPYQIAWHWKYCSKDCLKEYLSMSHLRQVDTKPSKITAKPLATAKKKVQSNKLPFVRKFTPQQKLDSYLDYTSFTGETRENTLARILAKGSKMLDRLLADIRNCNEINK